jgi:hypothetical protein
VRYRGSIVLDSAIGTDGGKVGRRGLPWGRSLYMKDSLRIKTYSRLTV